MSENQQLQPQTTFQTTFEEEIEEEKEFERKYNSEIVLPPLVKWLGMSIKEMSTYLPSLVDYLYLYGGLDTITYRVNEDDAIKLGLLPQGIRTDIRPIVGDLTITLDTSGGHSGGNLVTVEIDDAEITMSDWDEIYQYLRVEQITLRDFVRACTTFKWLYEKHRNAFLRGITKPSGRPIKEYIGDSLEVAIAPEPRLNISIFKVVEVDDFYYEIDIWKNPIEVSLKELSEPSLSALSIKDLTNMFKFAFTPLYKS